jgi:hypothetical protein
MGLLLVLLITGSATVRADVIVDTFGPGETWQQPSFVLRAAAATPPTDLDWAFEFTLPDTSYRLERYDMAFSLLSGDAHVEMFLFDDAGGNVPGPTLIESFDIVGGIVPIPGAIVAAPSPTMPTLVAGHTYWIGASATSLTGAETLIRWNGGFSSLGAYASRTDFGAWTYEGLPSFAASYRLTGTAFPVAVDSGSWNASWARVKGLYR